ncbi:MAG: PAS domain-containing protein [Bacteroidetes bacterium]|nr:PAS domain-containing protein [Bacteroidota bacterium]MBU1579223.1 PAS domain-containing protein [Bacteroidota bacterium]
MIKTKEQLQIENEELRSRVAEIEDALTAIRNGEVDAIMVSGSQGQQVYSVSSAETPYRTFIEEMSEGAVTLTKEGTILYCNQRFAEIVKSPYEKVIGSSLKSFITPNDNLKLDSFLAQLTHEKHDVLIVSLTNTIYLRLSIHLMPNYLQSENYILIATDISDLKKKEHELTEIIGKLVKHIKALRELRIDNICDNLDTIGRKNSLETANDKLVKEIQKLNRLVEKLKQKQKKATI